MIQGPVVLLILDGVGDGSRNSYDATFVAGMPHLNNLRRNYPSTQLKASEEAVGLPEGQFGNSEVGHMNLGAGRVVWQELTRINLAIKKGTFRQNEAMASLISEIKAKGTRLHLMGLLGPGGVHSHQNHLVALAQWANAEGVPTTIHAYLDGRDTPQKSADTYLALLDEQLKSLPKVKVGSISGRYWAMDRDKRWDRVEKAWHMLIDSQPEHTSDTAVNGIKAAYERGETDEFVTPTTTNDFNPIKDGDGIIFFNFRSDRGRQMSHALVNPAFDSFKPKYRPTVKLVTFTHYDTGLDPYVTVAYPPQNLTKIFGELVSESGMKQFRTAETEKYAHVTFVFNGGREEPFPGEERRLVDSPKVATYDLMPEMSCHQVVRGLVEAIKSNQFKMIICNLANGDMVGHTGILDAAVTACSVVDDSVRKIADAVLSANGALLVTADHGNSECMLDEKGNPHTAHTMNLVPCTLVAKGLENKPLRHGGALCDVAPTLLKLLNIAQPKEMEGTSLL
ncbi:MAG: 2,3-bisphosphoglycerate-independent phosphoglycerate mutase [Holophagales bacterium]|jgi:2,3-bisphosphoglycerate-independent phosphoglycerate mutase|nr:2,3-bisphosphoglycerate-independent phosphoglycerate mutase [Holophagales bacterium]